MREYIYSILHLVSKKDKKKIPLLLVLFLILSLFEVVSIGLIAPYISLITNTEGEVLLQFFSFLGLNTEREELIAYTSILLLMVFFIKSIMIIFVNKVIIFFSVTQRANLSSLLMRAYQSLPYEEFLARNSSEYVHNIQVLTSKFSSVLVLLLRSISDLVIGLSIFLLLAWQNFNILLILLSVITVFILAYDFWFKDEVKDYGKRANISSDLMIKDLNEGIKGLKEIRIAGRESYFYEKFVRSVGRHAYNSGAFQVIAIMPRHFLEFIMVFFIVSIVLSTILMGGALNEIIPTLGLFGVAALRLLPLSNTFLQSLLQLRNNDNTISRLYKDICQFESGYKSSATSISGVQFNSLELEDVYFSYIGAKRQSLSGVSIKIKRGESIGIVGKSGSGKTTLVDLLLGLLTPNKGCIYFNGDAISQSNTLNGKAAYIPQQVFLLDESLMSNISLSNKKDISIDRVFQAAKQARLSELIERLPNGIDTKIGESGVRISGGERQRIALARALYYDRDIIIMDEATSALDKKTEQEVVREIKSLKGFKTLVIIAHRLETIKHCDII
jgi:ABC-type multidrug transport system fused ATPase/permease subunit